MSTFRWLPPAHPGPPLIITPRMADVLTRLHRGMRNKEIARDLIVTEETVKSHMKLLLKAADANGRAHLVALTASRTVTVRNDRGRRRAA